MNLVDTATFRRVMEFLSRGLLDYFSWLFVFTALSCLLLCGWVAVSPLGRVRLGGPDAKPLMSLWNWFAITLCTAAQRFAISALYLHWTLVPYSVYGVASLLLGPTWLILQQGLAGGLEFINSFVRVGVMEPFIATDEWAQRWSVFHWAVWMAIWGTTTLHLEAAGAGLNAIQQQSGTEAVSYRFLLNCPGEP